MTDRLHDIEQRLRAKHPHGEDCPDDAVVSCGDVNYLVREALALRAIAEAADTVVGEHTHDPDGVQK